METGDIYGNAEDARSQKPFPLRPLVDEAYKLLIHKAQSLLHLKTLLISYM